MADDQNSTMPPAVADLLMRYLSYDDRTRRVIYSVVARVVADRELSKRGTAILDDYSDYLKGGEWPASIAA